MTVYEMFERSAKFFQEKTAVIFEDGERFEVKCISYNRLLYSVGIMARTLRAEGIKSGDLVCLYLLNSPSLITIYLALSKIGAVSVLLNPALPEERVKKVMADTGAKILVDRKKIGELWAASHSQESIFASNKVERREDDATSVVLYSSGTTGEQKGVELTVSNLYHNIRYTSMLTGMTPEDRPICFVPLTHCFGLNFIMGACFYSGATLVLHEKFNLNKVLASLVKNRVTMFLAVPAVYNQILKDGVDQFYFSYTRYFFYAADSMSKSSIIAWKNEYGRRIYTGWGLTETSPLATSNHEAVYKFGSVGVPIPGVRRKIINVDRGGRGEVCVKGHNVMKGYLNRPEETAEAIDEDGWFHTGDAGYLDEDGFLFLVGRFKNMINVGGEKAWPAEIEAKILRHHKVLEAAVIGIPHEILGEVPKAFVVKKEESLTVEELQEFLKPDLMKHEFPREVEFIEKIPRNPSGKILHRELRKSN